MTNMSYVIFLALVMLLQITNLSVSNDMKITAFGCTMPTIPKWNVQLSIGMHITLLPFQHPP